MSHKKIHNWFLFCLKMLPFFFLLISLVYFNRHDINSEIADIEETGFINVIDYNLTEVEFDYNLNQSKFVVLSPEFLFWDDSNLFVDEFYEFVVIKDSWGIPKLYCDYYDLTFDIEPEMIYDSNDEYLEYYYINLLDLYDYIHDNNLQVHSSGSMVYSLYEFAVFYDSDDFADSCKFPIFEKVDKDVTIFDSVLLNYNNFIDNNFSMENLLNLKSIRLWMNQNMFGGNMPIVLVTIWNILLYEFMIDFIYLLYQCLGFILHCGERWVNKFYDK